MVKHNAYKQAAPNFAYSFIKFEEKKIRLPVYCSLLVY